MTSITDQVIHIVKDTDITSELHSNDWYSRIFAAGCDGIPTKECLKTVRDNAKYEQEEIREELNKEIDKLGDIVDNIVLLRIRSDKEFTVHTLADQNISDGEYGCVFDNMYDLICYASHYSSSPRCLVHSQLISSR